MTTVPASSRGLSGVASVTAGDGSIVVGGTGSNPTVSGFVFVSTVNLTAVQIRTLAVTPVQLVATPGAGKIIVPLAVAVQYKPGSNVYPAGALDLEWDAGGIGGAAVGTTVLNALNDAVYVSAGFGLVSGGAPSNAALFIAAENPMAGGPIATTSLASGGTLYAPDDTGTLAGVDIPATYKVLTVAPITGAVVTYSITAAGTSYTPTAADTTTPDAGTGSGLTINILTITPGDGTLRVTTTYVVAALA